MDALEWLNRGGHDVCYLNDDTIITRRPRSAKEDEIVHMVLEFFDGENSFRSTHLGRDEHYVYERIDL